AVQHYLTSRLTFYHENQTHPIVVTRSEVRDYGVANFALVYFEVPTLESVPLQIETEYQYLLDGFEATHRSFLVIENNPRTGTVDNESQVALIFGPGAERQNLSLIGTPWHEVMYAFIKHGVWHIWIGFDHILFIISLLLPSVMILRAGGWQPVGEFKSAFLFVVKVVTLFTIAHSVTLSLSALGIIRLPVRLVEVVIAASIIVVALNNIFPIFNRWIWLVVFGFGLFHGLGFANVLAPLGAERSSLLTALIGFNVGVEIGQLAIIAVIFPLFFMIRNRRTYQFQVLGLGSAALIVVSSFWLIERAFDL
ncbi:MAG: HupE/UreJ family protein, partial [Thiogranum sp.]